MKTRLILGSIATATLLFSGCAYTNMTEAKMVSHLSDNNSMTLYTFDKDAKDKSNCYNGCETKWPVFYGNLDKLNLPKDVSKSDFGTIKRDNGAMQTTYKFKPLYYFFKDKMKNEVKGDGAKGVWHIVK
jgi:predicted lipoprotein with Yx(FWY)xxD motif